MPKGLIRLSKDNTQFWLDAVLYCEFGLSELTATLDTEPNVYGMEA